MCCESCPRYEKCAVDDSVKDGCCKKCPDYYSCYGEDKDKREEVEDYETGSEQ